MPKSVPDKAKCHLHDIWHDIWQAETRVDAEATVDFLVATDAVKDHKAIARRARDRDVLPAFHDFPAEHWKPIRTTNPIESTFATVRHRPGKTKRCPGRKTGLDMAFKDMAFKDMAFKPRLSAQTKWRKPDAANRFPEIIEGPEIIERIAFKDGIRKLQNTVGASRHQLLAIALDTSIKP